MPSRLVTPPWDLCGFDRDYDPYAELAAVVWYRCLFPDPLRSARMEVERVRVDQNERDGEWRELAFMEHTEVRVVEGLAEPRPPAATVYVVPCYASVRRALWRERAAREFASA